jgi:hypothetical protein
MDHSDDDFLAARWTGRGHGPRRSSLSWRARIGVAVLAFVVLIPVSLALRGDTDLTSAPSTRGATVMMRPLVAATSTSTAAPPPSAAPSTTVAPTTVAPTTTTQPCPQRFEVRRGDSWYGLAEATGVSVRRLLTLNAATLDSMLFPGRSLCFPSEARRPPAPTTTTKAPPTMTRAPSRNVTTTPTGPPPTTVAIPPRASTDEVLRLIRQEWPVELHDEAIRIAQRESRLLSDVRNSCCWGLFQIHFRVHQTWLATQGVTQAVHLLDAHTNVKVARALYLRSGGWGPWGR